MKTTKQPYAWQKKGQHHGRAKHNVREKVSDGTIVLRYCPTDRILADILIKGLSGVLFLRLREMTGVVFMPSLLNK